MRSDPHPFDKPTQAAHDSTSSFDGTTIYFAQEPSSNVTPSAHLYYNKVECADDHADCLRETGIEESASLTNSSQNVSPPSLSSLCHSVNRSSIEESGNDTTGQDRRVAIRKMIIAELSKELSKKSELQEQLGKTQGLLEDATKQKEELTTEVSRSKRAQVELLGQVNKLLERLDLKDIALSESHAELRHAQASLLEATCTSNEASSINKSLRSDIDGLRQRLAESQASRLCAESELRKVRADLIEARSSVALLRSIIEELASNGKVENNCIERFLRSKSKKVQIAVYFADSPPRVILHQMDQDALMPPGDWLHHMDFWVYKVERPGTIRIAVGETSYSCLQHMVNHPSVSQEEWDKGHSMSMKGWHHKMAFWAYPTERPGTIRIAVGEAQNPHCININKGGESREEWNQGASTTIGKWIRMIKSKLLHGVLGVSDRVILEREMLPATSGVLEMQVFNIPKD